MDKNTQLPVEVVNEIHASADAYMRSSPDEGTEWGAYVNGATAYAPWKVKYDELCERFKEQDQAMFALQQELSQLKSQPAPGWVKASERLPKPFIAKFVRIEGIMSIAAWHKDHERFVDDAGDFHPADQVEWLDEQPAAGREEDAVAFAKFLDQQRNSVTPDMWAEKVVWNKPTAYQEWLHYFKQQKEK